MALHAKHSGAPSSRVDLQETYHERFGRVLFLTLLGAIFLFGGASRADALSQIVVRLISVAAICTALVRIRAEDLAKIRVPLALLSALAMIIAWQLLPVPYSFWESLSGREPWAAALAFIDLKTWRPASLSPDATLNSLLALLPMFGLLLCGSMAGPRAVEQSLILLLAVLVATSLLALIQAVSGSGYLYAVTSRSGAVGLFANRNHQSFFLACSLPVLAAWATMHDSDKRMQQRRLWVAICASAAVFPLCLITGSRAGLLLSVAAMILSVVIWFLGRPRARGSRALRLAMLLPALVGAAAVASAFLLSRDQAVLRLFRTEGDEIRFEVLPILIRMVSDFFPTGSGFGSFDPVFRHYELDAALRPQYLNQAHNDWLQIGIEGGAPALLLLILFAALFVRWGWRLWKGRPRAAAVVVGRAGSIIVLLLAAASLTDYPLRTPALGSLFVLAVLWMHLGTSARRGNVSSEAGLAARVL